MSQPNLGIVVIQVILAYAALALLGLGIPLAIWYFWW